MGHWLGAGGRRLSASTCQRGTECHGGRPGPGAQSHARLALSIRPPPPSRSRPRSRSRSGRRRRSSRSAIYIFGTRCSAPLRHNGCRPAGPLTVCVLRRPQSPPSRSRPAVADCCAAGAQRAYTAHCSDLDLACGCVRRVCVLVANPPGRRTRCSLQCHVEPPGGANLHLVKGGTAGSRAGVSGVGTSPSSGRRTCARDSCVNT